MERGERPWGTYTVLEENKNYKIKRIEVNPGQRLSGWKKSAGCPVLS